MGVRKLVLLDAVLSGTVALPVGDVKEPFIDAVAALTEPGHSHKLYELTGPRLLTLAEAVATIAEAAGRPINYVQVTSESEPNALRPKHLPHSQYFVAAMACM